MCCVIIREVCCNVIIGAVLCFGYWIQRRNPRVTILCWIVFLICGETSSTCQGLSSIELYFVFVKKCHRVVTRTKQGIGQKRREGANHWISSVCQSIQINLSSYTKIDASRESWSCLTIEDYKRLLQFKIKHKTRTQIQQCNETNKQALTLFSTTKLSFFELIDLYWKIQNY